MTSIPIARARIARIAATALLTGALAACSNSPTSQTAPASSVASAAAATPVVASTPPASLTPARSSAPSAAAVPSLQGAAAAPCRDGAPSADCVAPGRYSLANVLRGTTVTVAVPTGWFEWDMGPGTQGLLVHRTDAASGWGVIFSSVGAVSRDPCDATKGTVPADQTKTVDGLIDAMSHWPGFHVGRSKAVVIGGVQGKQVQVTATPTETTCPNATIWNTPQGASVDGYPMVAERPGAYPAQFIALDVNGELLVLRSTDFPETSPNEVRGGIRSDPVRHVADQTTLHTLLESIRIRP